MKKLIVVCTIISTAFLSQGLFANDWGSAKLNKKVELALVDDGSGDVSLRNIRESLQ